MMMMIKQRDYCRRGGQKRPLYVSCWLQLVGVVVGLAVTVAVAVEGHDGDDEHDQMHAIQMTTPTPEVVRRLAEMSRPTRTRSGRYHYEWIGEPEIMHGYGETKLITNCINTGDHPTEQTISTNFAHTFQLEEGDELDEFDLEDLLLATAANHSLSFTTRAGVRSLVHEKVLLEKRTKGTVLFRDDLIKLYGRIRKVFNASYCEQQNRHRPGSNNHQQQDSSVAQCKKRLAAKGEEYYLALKASETDPETGKAVGTFSVDYFGTDKYKHPQFYNLANRIVQLDSGKQKTTTTTSNSHMETDDDHNHEHEHEHEHDYDQDQTKTTTNKSSSVVVVVVDEQVLSPYACAEHALAMGKTIGLYQVNKMRCTLADMEPLNGGASLLDRDGKLVGHFDFNTKHHLDTSTNSSKVEQWKRSRSCDLILATGERWHCKKFQEKPSNVIMIRRIGAADHDQKRSNNKLEWTAGTSQVEKISTTQPSATTSTTSTPTSTSTSPPPPPPPASARPTKSPKRMATR